MTSFHRPLLFSALVAGLALANACGRTGMDAPSTPGGTSTGGTTSDFTGPGASTGGASQSSTSRVGGTIAGGTGGSIGGTSRSSTGGVGGTITRGTGGSIGGTSRSSTSASGGSITGGTGGAGRSGSSASGGSITGGTGGSIGGACDEVPCLAPLLLGCVPSGSCTSQSTMVGLSPTVTYCYSNGVNQQVVATISGSTLLATATFKRDGRICYSIDVKGLADGSNLGFRFLDGNGAQIATGTESSSMSVPTITCNDSSPMPVSDACSNMVSGVGSCVPGVCTF